MMHRHNKKITYICLAVFAFAMVALVPATARAADVLITLGSGFPITENNMAPGQTLERSFSMTNTSNGDRDLMIRFDDKTGPWNLFDFHIEDMIAVSLQEPDGTLATLPNGKDSELLKDLYAFNDAFVFDTLPAADKNPNDYKLLFTFSKDAGNDYQNKQTVFDLAVGIDSAPAPANDSKHHHHHHHGNPSARRGNNALAATLFNQGGQVAGFDAGNGQNEPEVQGEETSGGNVAGDSTQGNSSNENKMWEYLWWLLVLVLLSRVGFILLRKLKSAK